MLHAHIRRSLQHPIARKSLTTTRSYSPLPRIASPSFWQSLVPKPLRNRDSKPNTKLSVQTKPWNPATFFIVIFLVIGSNAVNLLAVKKDYISFSRQADAKIAALKDAIERVHRGEDVDIRKLLGTGDPVAEQEWEDVIKELQQERSLDDTKAARRTAAREAAKAENTNKIVESDQEQDHWTMPKPGEQTVRKADFY